MLKNHADRAIARHMLTILVLIVGAVFLIETGPALLSAADATGSTLGTMQVGQ